MEVYVTFVRVGEHIMSKSCIYAKIPYDKVMLTRSKKDFLTKVLIENGFNPYKRIKEILNPQDFDLMYCQYTEDSWILFKKFVWKYEYPWQKQKRLLNRSFDYDRSFKNK